MILHRIADHELQQAPRVGLGYVSKGTQASIDLILSARSTMTSNPEYFSRHYLAILSLHITQDPLLRLLITVRAYRIRLPVSNGRARINSARQFHIQTGFTEVPPT